MSDSPSAQVPSAVPNLAPWGFALGVAGLFPSSPWAVSPCSNRPIRVAVHMPLVAYGAVILAFVGALHWGIGMTLPAAGAGQRKLALAWSGAPALVAWLAIMLPVGLDLAVLIATFWCLLPRLPSGPAATSPRPGISPAPPSPSAPPAALAQPFP